MNYIMQLTGMSLVVVLIAACSYVLFRAEGIFCRKQKKHKTKN